ncbi:uncharacterized protein [Triticum aestivum]|uniref:uncharacterized protein n=1 Tax=Triticum aestivum TaxID=4565 RepID=UPI001D011157|nr:uncharacterized protein LOC123184554 [Triticum aestivum]
MGAALPLSPTVAAATPNTWGHFAKAGGEHGFFMRDPAADFELTPQGVSMHDHLDVHYHVNVFTEGGWHHAISGAMHGGNDVRFLQRPYAVVVNAVMYMVYVVGRVVAYNANEHTFDAVELPGDFAVVPDAGGTDYRVTRTTSGELCIAQT